MTSRSSIDRDDPRHQQDDVTEHEERAAVSLTVRDVMCHPFVLRSQSVATGDGAWCRKMSYPELGCEVRSENLEDALEELESAKFRAILARLPDILSTLRRDPIPDPSIEFQLVHFGAADLIPHLDEDVPTYLAARTRAAGQATERSRRD